MQQIIQSLSLVSASRNRSELDSAPNAHGDPEPEKINEELLNFVLRLSELRSERTKLEGSDRVPDQSLLDEIQRLEQKIFTLVTRGASPELLSEDVDGDSL
jgi:hypothetical protein